METERSRSRSVRCAGPNRQLGRMIELQILIAVVLIAAAVVIPKIMSGESVLWSLLVTIGWVAAIVGGLIALAFLLELPGMIRDWRTTPVAVRAAGKRDALAALRKIKPERLDVRAADRFGNTALHVACDFYEEDRKRAAPAITEFLLQHGADANAVNTHDVTPLKLAVRNQLGLDTVRRLLAAGAKADPALADAVAKSDPAAVDVVRALIEAGAQVNAPNVLGSTPLHNAARYGSAAVIRELIDRGAAVGARDRDGCTPLHGALWMPSLNPAATAERVAALVAAGADRDAVDYRGRTPRKLAEESGVPAVMAAMGGG